MKKNKIRIGVLVAVMALLLPVFGGLRVFADNIASSLTVSPPRQRVILTPGEDYKGSITVSNMNEATDNLNFKVTTGSFNDDYDGNTDLDTVTDYNQMKNWIKLDVTEGSVAPNGTMDIPFTIEVPKDAPGGGQYATIIVQSGFNADAGAVGIQNKLQIASIIYAEVAGNTRNTGEIVENSAPSFLLDGSKFEATSMVKNTGNVHTDAEYTLQVWPLFSGEEICTNEENPDKSLILPETQRYHAQKCELPSFGIFNIKQTVKIFDQVSTIEKMVIVCPIWLLFLILFIVALGVIYLFAKSKKRKND